MGLVTLQTLQIQAIWHRESLYLWGRVVGGARDGEGARGGGGEGATGASGAGEASGAGIGGFGGGGFGGGGPIVAGTAEAVRAALGDVSSDGLLASAAREGMLTLHLPAGVGGREGEGGHGGTGMQSGPGGREAQGLGAVEGLIAVEVPAIILGPAEAIDLLTSLPEDLAVSCGAAVGYWARLAKFVCSLISAKQFIPRVDDDGAALWGSWRVLVTERNHLQWLEHFAAAMPEICRAAGDGAGSAGGTGEAGERRAVNGFKAPEATHLVETFLATTADALIRRSVADDPFFRKAQERSGQPGAGPEVRWLAALLGQDRMVRIEAAEERAAFVQQAQAWLGQLDDTQAAALRLVFVLDEPEDGEADMIAEITRDDSAIEDHLPETGDLAEGAEAVDGVDGAEGNTEESHTLNPIPYTLGSDAVAPIASDPASTAITPAPDHWPLSLHLQSLDGEGELISATSLWGQPGGSAPILGRSIAKRQAALLAELSRAAEVFPPVQDLLNHPAPTGLNLSTTDAYAFMRHWAPILRDRSFGVVLPDWVSDPDEEIGLRLVLSPGDSEGMEEISAYPTGDLHGGEGTRRGRGGAGSESLDLSTGQFGLDSLVSFNWQVAVGNLRLSPAEFSALVARNVPLVKHKGRWLRLDLEATKKAVEYVGKQAEGKISLADAFRTAFTAQRSETGLNVIGLTGTSWIEKLLDQTPITAPDAMDQPKGFKGELRPYQLRGLHWMAFLDRLGLGACLADDMGLGKTIQLISLMLHERETQKDAQGKMKGEGWVKGREAEGSGFGVQGSGGEKKLDVRSEKQEGPLSMVNSPLPGGAREDAIPTDIGSIASDQKQLTMDHGQLTHPTRHSSIGPTLLFAPTSVVGNWLRELQRFAPNLRVMVHHGSDRHAGEVFAKHAQACDVVVTSYSLAQRDKEEFGRVRWHRIALDEAQKIKNPAAASTIAIRALYAPHRVAMTGTPIENHLSELWSIMQVLNPGLLGTAADFREKFAVPIEKIGEKERAEQLRKMIRPFILRRTKQDPTIAGDLPEKLEMKVFCNLTAEQAASYERLVNDSLRRIDVASGIQRRGLILATLTRLKQICNHPALLEENPEKAVLDHRSGKLERLIDMVEELLEEGDAALVFTQYRQMGHLLERAINKRLGEPTFFLHGGTPAKGRDDMIQAFQAQAKGGPRIFLLSLRAGGLGLNLTAANHVFHFDRWWNPAVEAQATDRAHRVGQTRTVQVHKFVCLGTMEERIDKLLSEKQALADQIVGSGDEWLTGLSTDQLREYLSLSREAVGEFE